MASNRSNRFSRLVKILAGATATAEEELFQLEGRVERFVHFWTLVIRQFIRNRCFVRASALSYSTLIALIPLLAVALGVTSSFLKSQDKAQFQHAVEKFVAAITPPATIGSNEMVLNSTNVIGTNAVMLVSTNSAGETNGVLAAVNPPETQVVNLTAQKEIADKIWSFVQRTQGGTLGATGVVLLIFMAVSLLGRVEETFNDIWGVTRGRHWLHQMQVYPTAIMLGPLLLITALGLAGGAQFQSVKDFVAQTPVVGNLIFDLLPLLVLWLAFAFVYMLLPNTKVKFSAAIIGGAIGGTLWHLNNVFGSLYVSRVVTNSKIYGSIGLVPVFMVGIYFSWVILLFGAQVAYCFQNRAAYFLSRQADNVNQRGREFVALRLMTSLAQRFQNGRPPATIMQLSRELGVPGPLAQTILRTLAYKQLVTEVAGAEAAFVPARPLETINAYDILLAMRTGTGQDLPVNGDPALAGIYGEFARIEQAERAAASSLSLHALALRQPRAQELAEPAPAAAAKQITDVERIVEPKTIAAELARPKTEPVPVATPQPVRQPTPAPPPQSDEANSATLGENPPARREVVMPAEDREFPL